MSVLGASTNRLACNSSDHDGILDLLSGQICQLFQGGACQFQCALFNGEPSAQTFVTDTSNILSIDFYMRQDSMTGTLLLHKSVNGSAVNDITYANWVNGTAQQFIISLTEAETNWTVPSDRSLRVFFTITASTSATTYVTAYGFADIVDVGLNFVGGTAPLNLFPVLVNSGGLIQNTTLNFTGVTIVGFNSALGAFVCDTLQTTGDILCGATLTAATKVITPLIQNYPAVSDSLTIKATANLDLFGDNVNLGDSVALDAISGHVTTNIWYNCVHHYFGAPSTGTRRVAGTPTPFPAPLSDTLGYFARSSGGLADVQLDVWGSNVSGNTLYFRKFRGTPDAPLPVLLGDALGTVAFSGYHSGGGQAIGAKIGVTTRENWTNTQRGSLFIIQTILSGAATLGDRLTIDGAGQVSVANDFNVVGAANLTNLKIGGGAMITKVLKTTFTWDIGTIAASDSATNNVTLTGVLSTDVLIITPTEVNGFIGAQYDSSNTVKVTYRNITGVSVDPTPSAITFTLIAIRF